MYVYTYLVNKTDSDFNKLFDTLNISTVLTLQWYGYKFIPKHSLPKSDLSLI